jgi:hypothetical protein
MAEVNVGDSIRITVDQYAAPVGTIVEVTSVDQYGEFVKYRWTTPGDKTFNDWYADEGKYELVGVISGTVDADSLTAEGIDCESPWPSDGEKKSPPEDDPVNHPSHYTFGKYEVLDVIEDWGLSYHLGNATKYIARAGRKDPTKEKQDLEKAIFYIQRRVRQLGD